MNEGKFKKQLNKFPNIIPLIAPDNISLLLRMTQDRMNAQDKWEEEFRKIIDEAKKNFPIAFIMEKYNYEDKENPEKVTSIDVLDYPNAKLPANRANALIRKDPVIDWFLNYFGDSE